MAIDIKGLRITKLREYLIKIIDDIIENDEYQINANMLSNDTNNYSLDRIPVEQIIEQWIIWDYEIRHDVYSFRSRNEYSQDTINNLENVGFYEIFERIIKDNNDKGILPNIENIEGIKCLNCGTMIDADSDTAEFEIQIEIQYRVGKDNGNI